MSWTRILAPLVGDKQDTAVLQAAASLAAPFHAKLTGAFAAVTPSSLFSWVGPTALSGMELALGEIQQASSDGERDARARFATLDYPQKEFEVTNSEDWSELRTAARLSDVVVFGQTAIVDTGFLTSAFQQVLMDERRPVLLADAALDQASPVAVAWDGGREASRAARRAIPWLQKANEVVVLTAPAATPRPFDAARLMSYLLDQGVRARLIQLSSRGEAGPLLLQAIQRIGATMLVAGAFGHPRFQRFIFGGTTQTLLQNPSGPALFLSH